MTHEEITQANALIAEFMGAYIAKRGQQAYDHDDNFPNGMGRQMPEVMQYHASWDWLMPVVGKVTARIGGGMAYDVHDTVLAADIDKTYNEVVHLITWYKKRYPEVWKL